MSFWKYNWSENLDGMEDIIRKMPSFGIFKKSIDSGTSKNISSQRLPVSWILQYPDGTFGNTFTLPEYRCKGFASILYNIISENIFLYIFL